MRPLAKFAPRNEMIPPVRSTGSDAAFVAPGQHVKLGQHRGGEPMVRSHFANEPTEAAQQVVNIRLVTDCTADASQWCGIANLKIHRQRGIARGHRPRISIIGVIEDHDLEDGERPSTRGLEASFECIPVGRYAR